METKFNFTILYVWLYLYGNVLFQIREREKKKTLELLND